jgi:GNAT superfamily N-acetyltransferase
LDVDVAHPAEVHFRPAGPDDLDVIGRSLGPEHRVYFSSRMDEQRRGEGAILVAMDGADLLGAVWASWMPPVEPEIRRHLEGVPVLYHFEVGKQLRGQGIGTGLLRYAERMLAEIGHTRVALGVNTDNRDARRLYERLGYVAHEALQGVRTRHDDPANPFDDPFDDPFDVLVHGIGTVTLVESPSVTSATN